jgi:hypothetical protein
MVSRCRSEQEWRKHLGGQKLQVIPSLWEGFTWQLGSPTRSSPPTPRWAVLRSDSLLSPGSSALLILNPEIGGSSRCAQTQSGLCPVPCWAEASVFGISLS